MSYNIDSGYPQIRENNDDRLKGKEVLFSSVKDRCFIVGGSPSLVVHSANQETSLWADGCLCAVLTTSELLSSELQEGLRRSLIEAVIEWTKQCEVAA